MTDDRTAHDTQDQEVDPPPELADWWVWSVRKIAAVIADLLLAARPPTPLRALERRHVGVHPRPQRALGSRRWRCRILCALGRWHAAGAILRGAGLTGSRALAAASPPREARLTDRHPASGAAESGRGAGIVSQAMAGMAGVKCISPAGPVMMSVMSSANV